MGGLFRRLKTTSNNLDSDLGQSSPRMSRFFRPNLGDFQKKRSPLRLSRFFCLDLGDQKKVFWSRSSQVLN